MSWDKLADDSVIGKTVKSLEKNGMTAVVVENRDEALNKVVELIPQGSEVMNVSSTTLDETGISEAITDSGRYNSVRKKITSTDQKEARHQMRRMSSSADYVVGSVHAVTEDGQVVIVSNSGSQLAPYASGSANVIWVVGTQKIAKNLDDALRRIRDYVLPLENERMQKAYGMDSNISKTLIIDKEIAPGRITLVFVKEKVGF